MAPKYAAVLVFMFTLGLLSQWVLTQSNPFADSENITTGNALLSYMVGVGQYDFGKFIGVGAGESFFTEIYKIMTFDFPVLNDGALVIVRWLVIAPITATVVMGLILSFVYTFQHST